MTKQTFIDNFLNMKTKVSGGNTTTYDWDFENNLMSIDYPGTANDDLHEYDGQSRRMRSKLAGAANWTNFIWDEVGGNLLAEYTLISSTYTIKSENTWGLGLISTNRESTKRYFHFDGTGNSIALTDSSENITDTYGYTESGVPVSSLDSGTSVNPYRWMGELGAYDDGAMGSAAGFIVELFEVYSPQLRQAVNGSTISEIVGGLAHIVGIPPGPHRPPCSDLLAADLDAAGRKLIACLVLHIGNAEKSQGCLKAYEKQVKGKARESIIKYIACLFGASMTSDYGLDPCSPVTENTCDACCYSKYMEGLLNCLAKTGASFGHCVEANRGALALCINDCI